MEEPAVHTEMYPGEAVFALADISCGTSRRRTEWLRSRHGVRWRLWDFLVGWTAFCFGFLLSPHVQRMPALYYLVLVGGLYGGLLMIMSRLCGVPNPEDRAGTYELIAHTLVAVVLTYLLFATAVWVFLVRHYGRYIVLTMEATAFLGLVAPRWAVRKLLEIRPLRVVVYGAGESGRDFLSRLRKHTDYEVVGFLDRNPEKHGRLIDDVPVLGSLSTISGADLGRAGVDLVVICVGPALRRENANRLLGLPLAGIDVLNKGAFFEYFFRVVSMDYYNPHWLVSAPLAPTAAPVFLAKRLIDIGAAAVGLILSLPVWGLIAVAIRLDDGGPVFFRQWRVGLHGRRFRILKFRTMRPDAEKDGPKWACEKDPRVTRVGRFLRVTRLDELPQLWNVLKGEMSLVGPRPERPEFVEELAAELPMYNLRHLVPPGITGWAQIRYRYGSSKEDAKRKLEYDLYYVRHLSLLFDLEIMLRTIPLVMKGSR